jgi:hypothetical protein
MNNEERIMRPYYRSAYRALTMRKGFSPEEATTFLLNHTYDEVEAKTHAHNSFANGMKAYVQIIGNQNLLNYYDSIYNYAVGKPVTKYPNGVDSSNQFL